MNFERELHYAIYKQDKALLSEDFLYSEEGYEAAVKIASDLGLFSSNQEHFIDFLDRIFSRAEEIRDINMMLMSKMFMN